MLEMFGGYRENLYLCTRFSELRHTPNTESNEKEFFEKITYNRE